MKRILLRENLIWQALRADNNSEFDVLWKILQSSQIQGYITTKDLEVLSRRLADEQDPAVAKNLLDYFCKVLEIYPENEDVLLDATIDDDNLRDIPADEDDIPLLSVEEFLQRYAIYELYSSNRQSVQLKQWYRKWISSEFDPLFIIPLVFGIIIQYLPAVKDLLANLFDSSDSDQDPFKLGDNDSIAKLGGLLLSGNLDTLKRRSQNRDDILQANSSEPTNITEDELLRILPEDLKLIIEEAQQNSEQINLGDIVISSLSSLLIVYGDQIDTTTLVDDYEPESSNDEVSLAHFQTAQDQRVNLPYAFNNIDYSRISKKHKDLQATEIESISATVENKLTISPTQTFAENNSDTDQNQEVIADKSNQQSNAPKESISVITLISVNRESSDNQVGTAGIGLTLSNIVKFSANFSRQSDTSSVNPILITNGHDEKFVNLTDNKQELPKPKIPNADLKENVSEYSLAIVDFNNQLSEDDPLVGIVGVNVNTYKSLNVDSGLLTTKTTDSLLNQGNTLQLSTNLSVKSDAFLVDSIPITDVYSKGTVNFSNSRLESSNLNIRNENLIESFSISYSAIVNTNNQYHQFAENDSLIGIVGININAYKVLNVDSGSILGLEN